MKQLLFTLSLSILPGVIFACSCAGPEYFSTGVNEKDPIVMVKVGGESSPGFYEFEILDHIINSIEESQIVLQSSTGWNCLAPLHNFSQGDTMVFHLISTSSTGLADTLDYALTFCGTQYLKVQNGQVLGKIEEGVEVLPYSEFKNRIEEIGNLSEIIAPDLLAKASPNPVENVFTLESQHEIAEVLLFDLSGRPISLAPLARSENKMIFNISDLPGGIYLLKVYGLKSEETLKLVKT